MATTNSETITWKADMIGNLYATQNLLFFSFAANCNSRCYLQMEL